MPETLIPVLVVFIVIGLPVLSLTLIKLAKIIKGESSSCDSSDSKGLSSREEAEVVQDINQLVSRLEKRIDSLETIVLDKANR
jgi:hypothetical protein